jgi:hypothetical protein
MSKRIHVVMLALLIILTGSLFAQETQAPKLTVLEPIKDFGTVAKGEKLEWAFQVKNNGTADLEIIAARPACGCTVAEFDKVIKPGQTGKVKAVVDTAAFAGPVAKAVTLETNDPVNPSVQVTIHAVVKPYVEAHPAGFVRYMLLQGDAETKRVLLYSEEKEPFEIVKVEAPQEWIKVDYKKAEGDEVVSTVGRAGQNQYRLNITVGGPDAKIGPLAEKIKVITNSKHQPEYNISVSGVVRPTFRVDATAVNFGEVAPTDVAAKRSVVLRSNNLEAPDSFVVSKVESSVASVKADVKPTAMKGEYEVTLQVDKDAKAGEVDGSVKIYTNDKITPVVTIPVKATIKSATPTASK